MTDPMDEMEKRLAEINFVLTMITTMFVIIGLITNSVSIFIYTRPNMRSSMNILLAALAVFDFCLCLTAVPTFILPPIWTQHPESKTFSLITAYGILYAYPICCMAKSCAVWTLVYITVQRWITVRKPFRRARGSSMNLSIKALTLIVVCAFFYNLPRFFEHKPLSVKNSTVTVTDDDDKAQIRIIEDENEEPQAEMIVENLLKHNELYMSIYYSALYLLTHFAIPFLILALINGRMAYSIRRTLLQHRLLSHSEKAAAMMASVVAVFAICNTLPFILNFVEFIDSDLFNNNQQYTKIIVWTLNDLSNILVLISTSATFFIYYWCNQKYARLIRYYLMIGDVNRRAGSMAKKGTIDKNKLNQKFIASPTKFTAINGGNRYLGLEHRQQQQHSSNRSRSRAPNRWMRVRTRSTPLVSAYYTTTPKPVGQLPVLMNAPLDQTIVDGKSHNNLGSDNGQPDAAWNTIFINQNCDKNHSPSPSPGQYDDQEDLVPFLFQNGYPTNLVMGKQ